MKRKKANIGLSTIVAEMLILAIVVILATAFVVSLHSNVSYYVKNKELSSIYLWTATKNGWTNFTVIHSGGDPTDLSGRIYFEYENGTSIRLPAELTYNNASSSLTGEFELTQLKFGEHFQISVNSTALTNGTIHYVLNSKSQILAEVDEKIET